MKHSTNKIHSQTQKFSPNRNSHLRPDPPSTRSPTTMLKQRRHTTTRSQKLDPPANNNFSCEATSSFYKTLVPGTKKGFRRKSSFFVHGRKTHRILVLAFLVFFVLAWLATTTSNSSHNRSREITTANSSKLRQKILFLAGPHKTGSSTIQYNSFLISKFTESWAFVDPWATKDDQFKVVKLGHEKHFAALLFALRGQLNHPYFVNTPAEPEKIINAFREDIEAKWNQGKSITVGSEEIDFAVADYEDESGINGTQFLDGILSTLPANTKHVTEVIIAYRSPRAKHFLSLWKEIGVAQWNQTLKEFIFHHESYSHFHTIDILPLIELFVQRGYKILLVDIGGVRKQNLRMFQLLACHLMNAPCDTETHIPLELTEILAKSTDLQMALYNDVNVRTDGVMDLEKHQIEQIEESILRYDCGFKDAVYGNELVQIIFDDTFTKNMNQCNNDRKGIERISRKELWKQIQRIADPVCLEKENQRKVVILAGPHFSQIDAMSTISFHYSAILRNRWSFVAPKKVSEVFSLTEPAYGSSLLFALSGQLSHPLFKTKISQSTMSDMFHQEIGFQFGNGRNLIFGSTEFDLITSTVGIGNNILHETTRLFSTTGYDVDSDLKYTTNVVIGYYAPRVDHLLLLWNELKKSSTFLSFHDFLKDESTVSHLHTIDPLAMAEKFLSNGFHVTLIDIFGKNKARLESFQVLACDIMQEQCNNERMPLFLSEHRKYHPEVDEMIRDSSVDAVFMDNFQLRSQITATERIRIEKVLQNYDCNFKSLLQHDNLTVLYDTTLSANMEKCSSVEDSMVPPNREIMWKIISASSDADYSRNMVSLSLLQH